MEVNLKMDGDGAMQGEWEKNRGKTNVRKERKYDSCFLKVWWHTLVVSSS